MSAVGRVVSVNVSAGGVPKLPIERAAVGRLGLEGDGHTADVHGGPDRAVCLLASEAIARIAAEGHPIRPGAIGENLTTAGVEFAALTAGTRLAIGEDLVLELAAPAMPCDTIKGAFRDGRSGRVSILRHPLDSRMYARVLREGAVAPGDPIEVLPPLEDSRAVTLLLLDLLEAVERDAWLTLWRSAASVGVDVRILDRGDLAAAASPTMPGDGFNRAFGSRQVPATLPRALALFRAAGRPGWVVDAEEPFEGAVADGWSMLLSAPVRELRSTTGPPGLSIRPVDETAAAAWARVVVDGFELRGKEAAAWPRLAPALARSRGQHLFVGELDGRPVAAGAVFVRRRVAWLGGAAVLPHARGQGVQRSLIAERVTFAVERGAEIVMASADPDSPSERNLQSMGLQRLWGRRLWRFDP
jgi:MOSC domain-containing protein YiiM/GNAT superfamily N-acetyltransferase